MRRCMKKKWMLRELGAGARDVDAARRLCPGVARDVDAARRLCPGVAGELVEQNSLASSARAGRAPGAPSTQKWEPPS
jgi:hypothetical protein